MKNIFFDHSPNFFTAKKNFKFEEYNFSQSTLEQVCHNVFKKNTAKECIYLKYKKYYI